MPCTERGFCTLCRCGSFVILGVKRCGAVCFQKACRPRKSVHCACVSADIIIVIHSVIVKAIDSIIVKDIGADSLSEVIDEAEDESDKVGDMFGISAEDEYEDAIKLLKDLNTAGNIYSISGLIFVAMIPVANLFLSKKEEQ